jgi:Holliday junction DNA helicase RuvA
MFNSIRGLLTGRDVESVFILSGSIEWDISMPANDIQTFPPDSECRVFTWLYHREDQMKLFGFSSERRRNTFLELIKVEGIGPKGALKIMSGISQDDLERALENGDLDRLEAVPGLGKKTAQKMLLSLKGKLVQIKTDGAVTSAYNELVEALVGMGYDRRQAVQALAKAESSVTADLPAAEKEKLLFKEAVLSLSGA